MTRVRFVATRKNIDPHQRELYEMNLALEVLGLDRAFADLGLLTVAACTPPGVAVELVDEYVQPIDLDAPADLVALSAKTSCVTRAYQVADAYRARGVPVVMGGIHASLRPDEALQHVDCVVTGEAEAIWPQVIRDLERGALRPRYDAAEFPPLAETPPPAWHLAPASRYLFHQAQTTRGCPFACRFCSVPEISGQSFRFKPVERVIAELGALPPGGGLAGARRPLYVVDDNFISRRTYTKKLLRALVPLWEAGQITPWSAETTLNVAADPELLDLLQAAGCATLIIGFESVEEDTLRAIDKGVNLCMSYRDAIEQVHARGLSVVGNFIVGFDTDDVGVFKRLRDFVQETGILFPFFSILTPLPGTGLFDEIKAAGRLDHERWHLFDTRHVVMAPAQMSRVELADGYTWLYEQAYATEALLSRLERNWRWRQRARRPMPEKAFVAAALAAQGLRYGGPLRGLSRRAGRMLLDRRLNGDPGHLLFTLDATHYAQTLPRSAEYRLNAARFEHPRQVLKLPSRALQWQASRVAAGGPNG